MCSIKVAIFTGVMLRVKTSALYPLHYDHEVLPGEVQMFFKALSSRSSLFKFAFIGQLLCPDVGVKYVAHRASC